MLTIKKIDRYSIHFLFTLKAVTDMLVAFQKTLSSQTIAEMGTAKVDLKIFKSRSKNYKELKLLLNKGEGNFYIQNNQCILELDSDDLELGIELLENNIQFGYFEVAEFTKVKILNKNLKQLFQIYFIEKKL